MRNALYTAQYLLGVQHLNWWNVKFLDEVQRCDRRFCLFCFCRLDLSLENYIVIKAGQSVVAKCTV